MNKTNRIIASLLAVPMFLYAAPVMAGSKVEQCGLVKLDVSGEIRGLAIENLKKLTEQLVIYRDSSSQSSINVSFAAAVIAYLGEIDKLIKNNDYGSRSNLTELLQYGCALTNLISSLSLNSNPMLCELLSDLRLDPLVQTQNNIYSGHLGHLENEAGQACTLLLCQLANLKVEPISENSLHYKELMVKEEHILIAHKTANILGKVADLIKSELNKPWYKFVQNKELLRELKSALEFLAELLTIGNFDESQLRSNISKLVTLAQVLKSKSNKQYNELCPLTLKGIKDPEASDELKLAPYHGLNVIFQELSTIV